MPYDYHMLLAMQAPRPLLVVSPALDREATLEEVTASVARARRAYDLLGAGPDLRQETPEDYNRFGPEMQDVVVRWLKDL